MPRRPSWSEPRLCQRNGFQSQGIDLTPVHPWRRQSVEKRLQGGPGVGPPCAPWGRNPGCWQRPRPSSEGCSVPPAQEVPPSEALGAGEGEPGVNLASSSSRKDSAPFCALGLINSNAKSSCLACGPRTGGCPWQGWDKLEVSWTQETPLKA